jgi:hypothetical protein
MSKHFRTRTDIVEWLIDNCPRPAIVRALESDSMEFLGGFVKIPPSNLPGWIFKVKLVLSDQIKYVCILANEIKHKYEIRIVKHVPWEYWQGVLAGIFMPHRLNSGDNSNLYKSLWELKNAEKSRRST